MRSPTARTAAMSSIVAILLSTLAGAQSQPASADDLDFFESKVRPLLAEHCFECHSSELARPKGKLVLDSRERLFAGGTSGEVIVAGDPDASLLIEAVRYEGTVQMPPTGKLDDAQIATLVDWVRRGAPMPEGAAATQVAHVDMAALAKTHWAFQRIATPTPPDVRDELWCRNDIDRFVLAHLESEGLAPAPEADRRTLLRRLSFDLIGLPPSDAELDAFERDTSPDAWGRQIDRLLASPHYGERWGRYWLDLARYSDSNGLDENLAMSNAWRYRDWVVRALNDDLPYDQFLTWQIAGDLLPEPADDARQRDQLAATGFLVLGPKMLAEQDKEKLVLDVVDEQLDVAFRTFNGLTLGCARCHDHKFDPIAQRDYYSIAGVFKSTETMANVAFVSRWNERELARKSAVEARRAAAAAADEAQASFDKLRNQASDALLVDWTRNVASYLLAGAEASRAALFVEAEEFSRSNLIADSSEYGSPDVVVVHTGKEGDQFAEYDLTFAEAGRRQLEVRVAAAEARPMRVSLDGRVVFDAVLGEVTGSWKPDGQRWTRLGALDVRAGRNVLRFERMGGPVPHLDKFVLVPLAEGRDVVEWPSEGNPWAQGLVPAVVRAWAVRLDAAERHDDALLSLWAQFAAIDPAQFEARASELTSSLRKRRASNELAWNPLVLGLLDGLPPMSLRELAGRYQTLVSSVDRAWREQHAKNAALEKLDDAPTEAVRQLVYGAAAPFRLPEPDLESLFSDDQRTQIVAARAELDAKRKAVGPAFDSALGVRDSEHPADMPLLRRGNHLDKTEELIARAPLPLFADFVPREPIGANESGRLQLAHWFTHPEQPLTTRVAVNRVWQGHFGRGLVRSSSNFGVRGEGPSHPELLDWLAREFVRQGWSLKSLHRLICSSATYRMSCEPSADAHARDPENRSLAHQNRRRLEAEAIRDALLAASGELDTSAGGSLVEAKNGDYITNDQSKLAARFDAPRRSLYLPIVRNAMLDLFSVFDYPDSSVTVETRPSTTSPSQALYLMNSPLVISVSRKIVDATSSVAQVRERVDALYRRALSRPATTDEVDRALAFVDRVSRPQAPTSAANIGKPSPEPTPEERATAEREAWRALAQVLLVSNEFLFID